MTSAAQTPPGVYNVRQLVVSISPLLNAIVSQLGEGPPTDPPARSVLVDGLAASLATTGRESTLPLTHSTQDTARREIAYQATRVAKTLIRYVHDAAGPSAADASLRIRSPCEGHLWTPAVASLLLGPRSNAQLMELYNEWLHRMILLRDSLLPFENFDEVPLVIPEGSQGIRDVEEPRKLFLVHCLTGSVQHTAIVNLSKVFTTRKLPPGGYGFQYSQGLVLPAFLSGSRSLHLLRYHPARFDNSETEVLFDYEHPDYFSAPRSEVHKKETAVPADGWNLSSLLRTRTAVTESSFAIDGGNDSLRRIVKLRLTLDSGTCVAIDLGQIARGRRYAYEVTSRSKTNGTGIAAIAKHFPSTALVHSTADILSQPGLVTSPRAQEGSPSTIHIIPAPEPVIKLALLGKLYPENVILFRDLDDLDAITRTGKGFAERFVIFDDYEKSVAALGA
ncbi:hypothetical protein N657DRAFT_579872 [Parathielavia appendiculata]|uniref:Uncharacterized protein n=1 Tax=Parathielavia appendiculata TaxID=2587402 RepID=A0AAN6TTH5_9PEZI|nr:hypothetical protein N657DRAFT_579872 [Parathielavia appendiculata]